jgi:competence protein ComEA
MTRMLTGALIVLAMITPAAAGAQEKAPKSAPVATSAPLNLNTATVTQLEALPGVGMKVAERIVEYRQKNGGFKKVEDLMNVRGVGEKSFVKLKPMLTVSAPKTDRAPQQ